MTELDFDMKLIDVAEEEVEAPSSSRIGPVNSDRFNEISGQCLYPKEK